MNQPQSREEFDKRALANSRIDGFGSQTSMTLPCPFCAAPDWMKATVLDFETEIQKEHACSECGRTGRAIVNRSGGGVSMEIVQTGGDDPPTWLIPMRRV